jgi:hypothetical protein
VGSSHPPEHASHLGSIQNSMFLDAGGISNADYVIKLLDSQGIAASKAFNAESILACHTPKSKENDIFNVDVEDNDTHLNFTDRGPRPLVLPQDFARLGAIHRSKAAIVSQSLRSDFPFGMPASCFGTLSDSKAYFGTWHCL